MKRKSKIVLLSALFTASVVSLFSSSISFAYKKQAASSSFTIKLAPQANTNRITFYTTYSSSWGGSSYQDVEEGHALSSVPSVSLSGYTFMGWTTSAPSLTNYTSQISSASLLAKTDFTNDVSYYPILKCNTKQVYTNSNSGHYYYNLNETVTLSYKTLKKTVTGYRYIGFDGIPTAEIVSSYNNDRNLQSNNGKYVFYEENGGVYINREVGVYFKSGIWNAQDWEHDFIKIYKSGESEEVRKLYYKSSDVVGKYIVIYVSAVKEEMQMLRTDNYGTEWNAASRLSFSNYTSSNWVYRITDWNTSSWGNASGLTEATSNWGYD